MHKLIATAITALACISSTTAAQAATIGLHAATWHDRSGYEATTPGISWRADSGLTLGALRNSLGRPSAYAAWTWSTDESRHLSAAITAGLITGYDIKPAAPLVAPSLALRLADQGPTVRALLLPRWHPKQGATAVHFSVEWSLP